MDNAEQQIANAQKALETIMQTAADVGTEYGMSVIGAIVILVIGWWIAGWAKRTVTKALNRVKSIDDTLTPFLSSIVGYVVKIFVLVAVLNQFGVQTTSLIAILGAAGLAIGLALQGTMQNVAAGVMLLVLRPFKAGDFIDAGGQSGTVVEISLFTTEMKTPDGIFKSVPNSSIWGASITNFSRNPTRRIDVVAGISYGDDLPKAMDLLKGILDKHARILKDPAPEVMVVAMADSSVNINLRAWVKIADYWPTLFDLNKEVKLGLEAAGFTIPFPQQDVYMHQVGKAAE